MTRLGVAAMMLALAAVPAFAGSQEQQTSFRLWKLEDNCQRQARQQYPDYTAESNAKRAQAARKCIAGNNLPARQDAAAPAPEPAKTAD